MKSKFKGVDWTAPAASTEAGAPVTKHNPSTAPGAEFQRVADTRSQMLKENESLKAQVELWNGAVPTRKIPTNLIVRSKYANRHETNFESVEFASLREEIKSAGGNVQPIKVRPIEGGMFEVIFGHRRLEACKQNKFDVLAIVEELDDQALFVEMDRENRSRKDLSPWEQGVMYQRAIHEGLFPSIRKLAEALGVDHGNVSKSLALAELPRELVDAFSSPMDLQYRWAKPLRETHLANPQACIAVAKKLASMSPKPKPAVIFATLISTDAAKIRPSAKATKITAGKRAVATILQGRTGATEVHFQMELSDSKVKALSQFIQELMND
jgi:ParB family transcriptional regulator, chromosome partitioning protein